MDISLIVTTYNQKERLLLVLDSILHQSILPKEILIADDGSTQDTKIAIQHFSQLSPPPLLIRHIWQEDLGFRVAKIRNKAIKEARGEYLILIDGDIILQKDFIKDHLRFAKKGILVQGSRVLLNFYETQRIISQKNYQLAFKKFVFKALRLKFLAHKISKKIYTKTSLNLQNFLHVRSCNMSFYKQDCEKINGFNEDFEGWGREDSEFVARFLYAGGGLLYLKFAGIAYHLYHQENPRTMLEKNHRIYEECIIGQKMWCKNGLNKKEIVS